MTVALILIVSVLLGHATAGVVELSCSDNAACIENMTKEFVRSIRQQKTVKVFNSLTIEPLQTRQARSFPGPVSRFLQSHAFSLDWNDLTFKLWKDQQRSNALDFEIYESRSAKDVSEEIPKKSKSKVEDEDVSESEKKPKGGITKRRAKKKIVQAVIPMMFGMKSTAAVLFGFALVTILTLKAWAASKMALIVTIGMAVKRLYESYSLGVGLQNHPYLYSQYPIDFPSASSHAYSVSGVSPQFQPEMYNPTLVSNSQNELLQNDASAQQSQQAPTLQLLNSTRASERWDGKSKLQKLIEPIVDGIKSYIDPIASMFSMQTFRGMTSDVTTVKNEPEPVEEVKKPREFLVAQPRYIAQRKMNYRKMYTYRPKKYTELNVDLEKLKKNKDLYDYIKTKKYKHNYQHTYYYPRVKYFVNPNVFINKPKNSRLVPYRKEMFPNLSTYVPFINISSIKNLNNHNVSSVNSNEWQPVVLEPVTNGSIHLNFTKAPPQPFMISSNNNKSVIHKRSKRSLLDVDSKYFNFGFFSNASYKQYDFENGNNSVGRSFLDFLQTLFDADPIAGLLTYAGKYTKSVIKQAMKSKSPPKFYTITYDLIMMSLDLMDGLSEVNQAMVDYFISESESTSKKPKTKKKKKKGSSHKKKKKPSSSQLSDLSQMSQSEPIQFSPEYDKETEWKNQNSS